MFIYTISWLFFLSLNRQLKFFITINRIRILRQEKKKKRLTTHSKRMKLKIFFFSFQKHFQNENIVWEACKWNRASVFLCIRLAEFSLSDNENEREFSRHVAEKMKILFFSRRFLIVKRLSKKLPRLKESYWYKLVDHNSLRHSNVVNFLLR